MQLHIKLFLLIASIVIPCELFCESNAITFTLRCNGQTVPVNEQNDLPLSYGLNCYKYARVTYSHEPLSLEIVAEGIEFGDNEWDISPHSYGITGKRAGNRLTLEVDRTGYLVIRFSKDQDFTKRIVIFIEPPEMMPAGDIINIVERYNVDNSGRKNETAVIQQALDDISMKGATLYFPPGVYKAFSLSIKSNSSIHLARGARIIADPSNISSYRAAEAKGISRFIFIENAQNVRVTGMGTFDSNGTAILRLNDPQEVHTLNGMRLLFVLNSRNISFEDVIFKDAARWNTHMMGCEDITFRRCKLINNVVNNEFLGSLDGWDPDASKRVLIEDCFAWTGDDNVAVKCTGYGNLGYYNDVEDIAVRRCVFLTRKTSLKIGTETRSNHMRNIHFEDIDVIEADRVMGINVRDKATVEGVVFKNIRSENNFPDRRQMGINIYITRREDDQPWTGKINDVLIEDCVFEKAFPNKIEVSRVDKFTESEDLDVTFKNLIIGKKKVTSSDPDYFNLDKCNGVIRFE